jgi:hypothetical protein
VEHAWQLRREIRRRHPGLELGGWANPTSDPARQVEFLLQPDADSDFYLTQIVSHHQAGQVRAFLDAGRAAGLAIPGVFGVFYYRSANAATLEMLSRFLPVPVDALKQEFAAGATPIDVCARTIRALHDLGARHFYVSNLPTKKTAATLNAILEEAGVTLNS